MFLEVRLDVVLLLVYHCEAVIVIVVVVVVVVGGLSQTHMGITLEKGGREKKRKRKIRGRKFLKETIQKSRRPLIYMGNLANEIVPRARVVVGDGS